MAATISWLSSIASCRRSAPRPVASFQSGASGALESDGSQSVGVVLTINAIGAGTAGLATAVQVDLTTTGGNATVGGTDYALPASPAVTFAAASYASGTATISTLVGLSDDRIVEGTETADLGLNITQNIGTQVPATTNGVFGTHQGMRWRVPVLPEAFRRRLPMRRGDRCLLPPSRLVSERPVQEVLHRGADLPAVGCRPLSPQYDTDAVVNPTRYRVVRMGVA